MTSNGDPPSAAVAQHQYRDGSRLNARIALHARFATNPLGWHRWMLDQFSLPDAARILELGCGTGALWAANRGRIPRGWTIALADLSAGMLGEARANLAGAGRPFRFIRCAAQSIPSRDSGFDALVANHMLYHVPDRPVALTEMRRVLRPGGVLYASTISRLHMRELDDLARHFFGVAAMSNAGQRFGLENGRDQLAAFFDEIELRRYEDSLEITESEPIVAYLRSMSSGQRTTAEQVAALRNYLESELRTHRAIRVSKDSGLFIARRR